MHWPPNDDCWRLTLPRAERYPKKWYFWATHSRLKPVIQAAETTKHHWAGVLN